MTIRRGFLSIAVAASTLVGVRTAPASTVTLSPPAQALRVLYFGTPAGGDTGALSIYTDAEGQGVGGNTQHSLLQFDVSALAGKTITSATLTLTHDSAIYHTGQPLGTQADLYAAAQPWNTGATWNTTDGSTPWTTPGGTSTGTLFAFNNTVIPDNSGVVPVSFDVTSLVSDWTSGALTNDGILLTGTEGDGLHFYIAGADAPSLTITYTPEPASLALIGLGGLSILARRRRA